MCTEQGLPNNSMTGTVGANTALIMNSGAGVSKAHGIVRCGSPVKLQQRSTLMRWSLKSPLRGHSTAQGTEGSELWHVK